jgi:AcrR family transcriptional regulator
MADKVSTKSPIQARREEEKEQRRRQIVDAAERVIRKKGWEATNFGDVARLARLSRTLVYFYFPAREDLFHAVCERGLGELEKRFRVAVIGQPTGLEQLMAIGRAYHRFSQDKPLYFQLISQSHAKATERKGESAPALAADERGQRCLGVVAEAMAAGLEDGSVDPAMGNPDTSAIPVWAFTHGLILIAAQERAMLETNYRLSSAQLMEHGFRLLRGMLAAK